MKKLVLFDIDGTLIYHIQAVSSTALSRFPKSIKSVFGKDAKVDLENWPYNGQLDRAIAWDLVKGKGVTKKEFIDKLPQVGEKFREFLTAFAQGRTLYKPIENAVKLVQLVRKDSTGLCMGVLTGNLGPAAWWKLEHTGLEKYFDFGLFGHEAEDRNALAKLVFAKAKKVFNYTFEPREIVIIGDTVHDIRCGKAIGATTIAVTTGYHIPRAALAKEKPDLLVDSLMDEAVLRLLGLK